MPTTTEPLAGPATPSGTGFALFETPIGRCAIAWRGETIIRTALPESDETRPRFAAIGASEQAPPEWVVDAIRAIVGQLSGEHANLPLIAVDFGESSDFECRVYAAASAIPSGETLTYGELAARIGAPDAARAVGHALGRNPVPIIVPCHRVLAGGGRSGGFSAPGGAATKLKLLEIEGAKRKDDGRLFDRLPWATKREQP